MPYIVKTEREQIDYYVDGVLESCHSWGAVNYAVSTLVTKFLKHICFSGKLSYENLQNAMGLFECAKEEFYRRVVVPYEEKKIKENGDVASYKNLYPYLNLRDKDDSGEPYGS